jgi:hypothetical protein
VQCDISHIWSYMLSESYVMKCPVKTTPAQSPTDVLSGYESISWAPLGFTDKRSLCTAVEFWFGQGSYLGALWGDRPKRKILSTFRSQMKDTFELDKVQPGLLLYIINDSWVHCCRQVRLRPDNVYIRHGICESFIYCPPVVLDSSTIFWIMIKIPDLKKSYTKNNSSQIFSG